MVRAGEMPVPFPVSWCRLSGKGSLRQRRPLGSPQPACVSSFLRVGSSNIHCSRARRTGAYHPGTGGGGKRGRARRLPRRPLRSCRRRRRRRRRGEHRPLLPPPPRWYPHPRGPGSPALRHCPSGCVRAGGRRLGGSVTPDQLMLPACNCSWVTGPYLCTISAADGLHRTYDFPPSLFGCRPGFYLHLHPHSHRLCFVIQAGVGKVSDVFSTLLSPWALSPCRPLGKPCVGLSPCLPFLSFEMGARGPSRPCHRDLITEKWASSRMGGCSFCFSRPCWDILPDLSGEASSSVSKPFHPPTLPPFAFSLSLHCPCYPSPPPSRAGPTPLPSLVLGTQPSLGPVFCSCCSVGLGFATSRAGLESQCSHPLAA